MAQPPHFDLTNAAYFVTTSTKERLRIFEEEGTSEILLDVLRENREAWGYKLFAYVVMPDHIHLLIQPKSDKKISKILNQIKGVSSRKINLILKQEHVWQKGFYDFTIYSDKKFQEKFNYIHFNPVKWKIVKRAEDYPFSSAGNYLRKYGAVYYDVD
jgi:putative transposase